DLRIRAHRNLRVIAERQGRRVDLDPARLSELGRGAEDTAPGAGHRCRSAGSEAHVSGGAGGSLFAAGLDGPAACRTERAHFDGDVTAFAGLSGGRLDEPTVKRQ